MEFTAASQYALLFWSYCFLGWVWESLLVSLEQRRWINRGFLYGPWIPIYGFGALIILFTTEPFRSSALLVFFSGTASSTALEYLTGRAMEKLFQVRYWDYSKRRFNVDGYICLRASLTWGVFSVAIVDCVEPALTRLINAIPPGTSGALNLALTALFAADVVKSVQAAAGLRRLLCRLTANNARLAEAEARLNDMAEELGAGISGLKEKFSTAEAAFAAEGEAARRRAEARREKGFRLLVKLIDKERRGKYNRILMMEQKAAAALEMLERASAEAAGEERRRLGLRAAAVRELRDSLRRSRLELSSLKTRDYSRALSLLRRNPTASSRSHAEALGSLTEINRAKRGCARQQNITA